ncbi:MULTISPECIES: lipid kinase [unclassified Arsukibacterium]|uniref:lipid kinase n=1 Tax=unclassified Arsukibacterium TaxID=2635278 RepID=UPI000C5C7BC0|nr:MULTISPECIES: lipid kinase [unclassified Arsukibacterium]MAA95916.1 diacylglycerol kinase [Rheinheimera sp.]MBM34780.1 diacylglycerol kinase [Rheinheimera sp.]HAW91636.1 lipid kinase [Candidatus Azambacteria bacterium]
MQHALLIVNPKSRNGQAEELEAVIQLLRASGFDIQVYLSENEAQMDAQIANYQHDDGIVIIAGGDGTISSALQAIYTHQRTLAILPLGTANDLARSLGVPQDLAGAAQVIINAKRERINLAKVNDKLFINVAHIGLGVDVTHELTPETKKYFGVFAYLGAFFSAIKRNRSFKINLKADDWNYSVRAIHLAVGNGRFYGGGNIVDNASTLLDGQLSLFCIKPQRWWQLLLLGPSLRNGDLRTAERVICKTARKISINTTKPIELNADGEYKTKTPAEFAVIPEAIEVIAGSIPQPTTNKV